MSAHILVEFLNSKDKENTTQCDKIKKKKSEAEKNETVIWVLK